MSVPVLYDANEASKKNFTTNGVGGLGDALSCIVTEEKNGKYELEMDYPVDGIRFKDINTDMLIYAKPNETSNKQIFRIYEIEKPIDGIVTIHAEHISYLLSKVVCLPFEAASASGAFNAIRSNVQWNSAATNFRTFPFSFWTDNNLTGEIKIEQPKSVRSILCGSSGSILDSLGKGDYEFDNFTVKLYQQRGSDTGVTLRYGKNITDLTDTDDISNVYTGIMPYWTGTLEETSSQVDSDGNVITENVDHTIYITTASQQAYKQSHSTTNYVNGNTLWSENESEFGYPLSIPVDMQSRIELDDYVRPEIAQNDEESAQAYTNRVIAARRSAEATYKATILSKLTEAANDYLDDNMGWLPDQNIEVSFVQLWGTDEYKSIAGLERVSMGDTVTVIYPKLKVRAKMRVVKTVYDVLNDRYNSIEIGKLKTTTADAISDASSNAVAGDAAIIKQLLNTKSDLRLAIDYATALITGGLGGYVVFNTNAEGHPNEILIMDKPNKLTAVNVIRMNLNGIGFSTHGYNGPFETAWTIDGHFNANFITTGILTAIEIQTSTSGRRIVINDGDAVIAGYQGNVLHTVIDMLSRQGGTMLIDADHSLAIRTPRIIVSTRSQGDAEGTGTVALTQNSPFVTGVSKNLDYGSGEMRTQEGYVFDGSVYCTLPVYLDVQYGGNSIINGFVAGNATQTIVTI